MMLAISTLFAVLRFLTGRTTAMSTGNVFFLLGFGLHFTFVLVVAFSATTKRNAIFQNALEVVVLLCHNLMVEKTNTGKGHCNAVLIAGHDDMIITHGATGLSNELHATLVSTLNVVAKGEEGIAA